ncbi:DNA primase [Xylella fastidiosa]|uniref:DNA primase n=2 Tax=Xylella fastidiosa TaxID=2371 RepID=A0A060HB51_XYLFS|nr:DNA primase [Xylella fastidiosa]AIC10167.1 DNA primase [Xylella fastidiosa subsp. sandyi Ann-1]UIX82094.1 DNA primase [Xylella fastidiosa subsp. sandyi]WCF27798.1 DNA primase [Xylella fastidiosa subsp. fastidiosa]
MARIPDAFIDELLARTDIVEVVGSRLPLKRQGKEYASRCPFHDERSASFYVSPTKQFYHCFGCGAHGTAISFLMNYDRLEFLDAVDELAKRAGMEVPRETQQKHAHQDDSRPLYAALEAASHFFQKHLENNPKVQAYLNERGVDINTRTRFQIGYAPDGYSVLKDTLGTDERRITLLDRAGMLSKNDRDHVYDKFRDRVMFPIFDRRGRVIAFGGRVLDKDKSPKYLNSPETTLFHKSRELYGLWQVRQAHQNIERLIVVEGYMDVISLFQFGITQAVATLGTATTVEHAELLFRNTPDVYFCFDGDNAGRKAGWRALESILPRMKEGRQAFFLFLPDGEDPDTIVRKEGKNAFNERLKQAIPLSQFFFDALSSDIALHTLDGKARLAERARPLLMKIPEGAFNDLMRQRLAHLTGVNIAHPGPAPAATSRPATRLTAQKRNLIHTTIAIILQQPSLAMTLNTPYPLAINDLKQPGIALLLELLDLIHQRPEITTGALLEHFTEREEYVLLQTLATQTMPGDTATWTQELQGAMTQMQKQLLQQRLNALHTKQLTQPLDDIDKYELRELLKTRTTLR